MSQHRRPLNDPASRPVEGTPLLRAPTSNTNDGSLLQIHAPPPATPVCATLAIVSLFLLFFFGAAAHLLVDTGDDVASGLRSSIFRASIESSSSAGTVPLVSSRLDPSLSCTVMECTDMLYTGGADATIDRPGHLRAASSMQWITDSRLAIVQDDSNFIALADIDLDDENRALRITNAYSIPLPSSTAKGDRQFQKSRGNKQFKLDLEASVYVPKEFSPLEDGGFLLGFGSGSAYHRNVIILIRDSLLHATSHVNVDFQAVNATYWSEYSGKAIVNEAVSSSPLVAFYAPSFYEVLRHHTEFAGSELNIEGAAFIAPTSRGEPAKIRLFQRGNGGADLAKGLLPRSSTGEVVAEELFQYMDSLLVLDGQDTLFYQNLPKSSLLRPRLLGVVNFNLGSIQGVKLTFTGSAPATVSTNRIFEQTEFIYTAGAEASPDAIRDGAVVGTAMGLVQSVDFVNSDKGDLEVGLYNFLSYPNGTRFLHKTEGVAIPPGTDFWQQKDGVALTVLDLDDPNVPSQMCLVQIEHV